MRGRIFRKPSGLALCLLAALMAMFGVSAGVPSPSGGWSIVSSPNSGMDSNYLRAIDCASPSLCWAVGYYLAEFAAQPLIERWDGNSWTIVSSPNKSARQNHYLIGVTCVATNDCWAVGYYDKSDTGGIITYPQTLFQHWDGTSWTIVDSPNVGAQVMNFLTSVSCVSASDCWAVGFYNVPASVGFGYQPLFMHWNGVAWTVTSSAAAGLSEYNILRGVTCAAASDCWAVGYYYNGSASQTLIDHWDGVAWTAVATSPNTALTQTNELYSVACLSSSDCWAVGSFLNGAFQPLTLQWDGAAWSIRNGDLTPNHLLYSVACVASADCWSAGIDATGPNIETLVDHWNGATWSSASSDNVDGAQYHYLLGVTCASAADCWTAGYSITNGIAHTVIARHAPPVQLNAVVSRKFHGSSGPYDVDLVNGSIECRNGGGVGDYTLVFTFANPLTSVAGANVTSGTGSVSNAAMDPADAHKYVVDLTGVANAQTLAVSLANLSDTAGNFSSASTTDMKVLVGDTTGDGVVNSADIAQTKSQSGQGVSESNFRQDVTADGNINSADIALVKSKSGTGLP